MGFASTARSAVFTGVFTGVRFFDGRGADANEDGVLLVASADRIVTGRRGARGGA